MERTRDRRVATAQVIGAAVLFSTGGAAIKACSLSGWQVASFRSAVAFAAVLLMVPAARRGWSLKTLAVALAYAATMILYVLANKMTTAANTIFLQDTAPLWVLALSPWLLRERIHRRDLAFMAMMATGMVLFFVGAQPRFHTAPNPVGGNVLAVTAGVSWALTIMGLRWLSSRPGGGAEVSAAAVALGNLVAFAVTVPLALPVVRIGGGDLAIVIFLGVIQIGLAYVFLTRGVRHVPALEASLLLLIEPVLNPVWAWLAHGEHPGAWALAGGFVILGTTALKALAEGRMERARGR
ncbi:MAG: DMT family transporter [Acidobacteria bacterium]|nr:DMT family transporter [Acidobacteriota bacterium]